MTEAFFSPYSSFPPTGFQASWIPRLPDVDVLGDRDFALKNLAPRHDSIISGTFPEIRTRHHAEQIHGNGIALISAHSSEKIVIHPGVDGLVTNLPGELLAIYVADCAAIYLADPVTKSIALLHSGKNGTVRNILGKAVETMDRTYGTKPSDLVGFLSPCIRPPDYEIDFAASIREQAAALGIRNFQDSCENTASDLTRHYSYRLEKGQTGRMLALLSLC